MGVEGQWIMGALLSIMWVWEEPVLVLFWFSTFTILTGLMLVLHFVCPLRKGGSSSTSSISSSSSARGRS